MSSEVLKMTTEIVVSHASMTELTPEQLVNEIKEPSTMCWHLWMAGEFWRSRLLRKGRSWRCEKTVDPLERYRQGQIRGLS